MQMQEVIKYKVEEALEEAVEKAVAEAVEEAVDENTKIVEQRMAKLTQVLLDAERYEDLRRITMDADYRKKMMDEYGIV